jgi:phosphoglycolate phosphatase
VDYTLITFDLDGTLVDTACEIAEAANRTLRTHGIAPQPVADITLLIGGGTRQLMHNLLARCAEAQPALAGTVAPEQVMATFDAHYAVTTGTSAAPYPGCLEALSKLKAAGIRLACVTNKELHHTRAVLKATRLDTYFELTIGGDSLPDKKPHASVLQHVATAFGVSTAHMAHVGDSAIDVQAARNAGVTAWAVPYGYNAGRPIADARPDRIFQTLLAVANHVLGETSHAAS